MLKGKYTLKASLELLKILSQQKNATTLFILEAKDPFNILFSYTNKKYKILIVKKNERVGKVFTGTNYTELANEVYEYAKSQKILPIIQGIELQSEILETTIELPKDTVIWNPFETGIETNVKTLAQLDMSQLVKERLYKLRRKGEYIEVHTDNSKHILEYSRNQIIEFIMEYISYLISQKKVTGLYLNNRVSLIFQTHQQQKIFIVEGDEDGTVSTDFIDENLTNKFVLCSLADLAIDTKGEKIWLNKTILKEELLLVTFH